MHALVELAGKQFRVEDGITLKVPHLDGKIGGKVSIDKVLYFDDGKKKIIGNPFVKDMNFKAEILEHGRDKKVIVFKFKRRKGYQRKNGHRQDYTMIKLGKLSSGKKVAPKVKAETSAKNAPVKKVAKAKTAAKPAATKKAAPKKTAAKTKKTKE